VAVFPYSEYHIFYEQYAILVPQASKLLFSAIVVILVVMSLLLGNLALSLPVLLLLTLNQIDLIGIMQASNVHMNGARAHAARRGIDRPARATTAGPRFGCAPARARSSPGAARPLISSRCCLPCPPACCLRPCAPACVRPPACVRL
jgi:hypothetical protein